MYFMIRDDPSDIGMAHLPSQIGLWFCLNLKKLVKVERVEGLVIDTARLKNLIFHLTNRYIYECMWFYECRVHLKKPSWTCSMVFWLSIQGELSSRLSILRFPGCWVLLCYVKIFPSRGLGNMPSQICHRSLAGNVTWSFKVTSLGDPQLFRNTTQGSPAIFEWIFEL